VTRSSATAEGSRDALC